MILLPGGAQMFGRKFAEISCAAMLILATPSLAAAESLRDSLRNAYDNTIRYTDYHTAALIKQLGSLENTATAVIYVSDHGQSLGENGYYLHGAPVKIAPPEQLRIPFWVWMSPAFKQSRGLSTDAIVRDTTHPHDFPFHSVMGAFGMQSDIYKPEFDVFALPRN